jgi:hypothetical protein
MRISAVAIAVTTCLLVGCTKSPVDTTVEVLNAASAKFMRNIVEKNASKQAEALARNIYDRVDCKAYVDRLREAGRGPPAAGATQWAIAHTYADAGRAGCVRPD